jgi:hypothetical protein
MKTAFLWIIRILFLGILGSVTVDRILHRHWKIVPFEFKSDFVNKLVER